MITSCIHALAPAFVLVVGATMAIAGCAGEGADEQTPESQDVATDDDELAAVKLLDCKNTAGTTKLALTTGARGVAKWALKQGRVSRTFACTPGVAANQYACVETAGAGVRGSIAIATGTSGIIQANIATSTRLTAATLECTLPAPVAVPGPVYRDLAPVISASCGGCRGARARTPLTTLAQVKAKKGTMESLVASGSMPAGRPTWGASADGQKLLTWLRTGTDL